MAETIYRITGLNARFDYVLRKYVPGENRTTVGRSQKGDLAYYEDLEHATRGLRGLKGNNRYYTDFRIEALDGEWVEVS